MEFVLYKAAPSLYFWNVLRIFLKHYSILTKFPKSFWTFIIFPIFLGACLSQKKSTSSSLEPGNPPLFLKNVQTQAKKFLKSFEIR